MAESFGRFKHSLGEPFQFPSLHPYSSLSATFSIFLIAPSLLYSFLNVGIYILVVVLPVWIPGSFCPKRKKEYLSTLDKIILMDLNLGQVFHSLIQQMVMSTSNDFDSIEGTRHLIVATHTKPLPHETPPPLVIMFY